MLSNSTKEKLARAALILERVPEYDFVMKSWRTPREGCGTAHCVVGHAACDPWFAERGLGFDKVKTRWLILNEGGLLFINSSACLQRMPSICFREHGTTPAISAYQSVAATTITTTTERRDPPHPGLYRDQWTTLGFSRRS